MANEYYDKFKDSAKTYGEKDIASLIEKAISFIAKNKNKIIRLVRSARMLISAIKDYYKGKYKKFPVSAIIAFIAALAYLICPADAVPDIIPVAGFLDDAAVISLAISQFDSYINRYKAWKNKVA